MSKITDNAHPSHATRLQGCAPDAYQAIAASILASFTASAQIAAEPAVLELTEPLVQMLEAMPHAGAHATTTAAGAGAGAGAGANGDGDSESKSSSSQTDAAEAVAGIALTPEGVPFSLLPFSSLLGSRWRTLCCYRGIVRHGAGVLPRKP